MAFTHYWKFTLFALASFLAVASAQDAQHLVKRASSASSGPGAVLTAVRASETELAGRFLLENNLWGASSATSGSQTTQRLSTSGNAISWRTIYNWVGGIYKVKSFANLDLKVGLGQSLSLIKSISTAWQWNYVNASSDLAANVAYDMWLSNSSTGTGSSSSTSFEVMVWLSSRGGAAPYGRVVGHATVNGVTWTVYKGIIKTWVLISFLTPSETTNYNSDQKPFFDYLITNNTITGTQYLVQLQAGTEPFIGSATLNTSSYSVSINT